MENCSKTHPNAQISTLNDNWPLSYSGDIYRGVPNAAAFVAFVLSSLFDIPKSTNLTFS